MEGPSKLWFERLYAWLGMPFWVGAVVFGGGVFLAAVLWASLLSGSWVWFVTSGAAFALPFFIALGVYTQFAARFARRRVEWVERYTRSMRGEAGLGLRSLYSVPITFAFAFAVAAIISPLYILFALDPSLPLEQRVVQNLPYIYWNLFTNTFIWVLLYALYTIVRIGRLELELKPFTEDRALGLKPLGRIALELTGLYVLFLAIVLIPNVLSGFLSIPILGLYGGLSLIALALFFLPLLPLRRQLRQAKAELLRRLGPRYTRVFEQIDLDADGPISQADAFQLTAIEKIQRDVREIYDWPFDTGVVVRLSVIVFSVTAIVSARIIASMLGF